MVYPLNDIMGSAELLEHVEAAAVAAAEHLGQTSRFGLRVNGDPQMVS